jgi:adenylate cyclase
MTALREAIRAGKIGHIEATGIDKVIVKGKENAVGIFEIKAFDHSAKTVITQCEEREAVRFKEK